jgi:hypothetical protein
LLQEERLEKRSEGNGDYKLGTLYPGIKGIREMYQATILEYKIEF